jgi:hypothetical protein
MKSSAAILRVVVIFAASACSGSSSPISPSSSNPQTLPLTVGQSVERTWTEHGAVDHYELRAPSDGTLLVRLTWSDYSGVALTLADTRISQSSPIVATLAVKSGLRYRLTVADEYAWDYDQLFVKYVLTTAME